ncbi:hypothetical protein BTVI_01139 [Pitangus sulphuratus]|nr:hypothetical protein BTVI_01139 [Pitangus sulphuratus]
MGAKRKGQHDDKKCPTSQPHPSAPLTAGQRPKASVSRVEVASPHQLKVSSDNYQTVLVRPTNNLPVPTGKDILTGTAPSNNTGLTVIPQSVTADNPTALEVTVKALFPPMEQDTETPIVNLTPIAVGGDPLDSMLMVQWSQSVLLHWPMLTCMVFFPNTKQCVQVKDLTDTGVDVTIFVESDWPKEWSSTESCIDIKGVGGAQTPLQSVSTLLIEGPEGKTASAKPYVLNIPMTLWGRDMIGNGKSN